MNNPNLTGDEKIKVISGIPTNIQDPHSINPYMTHEFPAGATIEAIFQASKALNTGVIGPIMRTINYGTPILLTPNIDSLKNRQLISPQDVQAAEIP